MPNCAAARAPDRPSTASRRNASKVRGCTRSRTRAIASSSNSRSNSSSNCCTRSSRLGAVEQPQDLRVSGPRLASLAAGEEVAPGVVGEGAQPAAEAAGRVVGEGTHLGGELEQDIPGDVFGVGLLEPPVAAPAVALAAV